MFTLQRRRGRVVVVPFVFAVLLSASLVPAASAAPARVTTQAAQQEGIAGKWLAAQIGPDGHLTRETAAATRAPNAAPLPKGASERARAALQGIAPDGTDWGLTIDFVFAMRSTDAETNARTLLGGAVKQDSKEYWAPPFFDDPNARIAGATAKTLVAAEVNRDNPKAYGGSNLRNEVLNLIAKSGVEKGRIKDRIPAYPDYDSTNTFSQSLAVIGLAGSGGVPRSTVDFLARQQCSAGYFRMFYNDKLTCDQGKGRPDGDGTAMALSALLAAKDAGAKNTRRPIMKAVRWLKSAQKPDGSFGGGVTTEGANTNSTGLIAQALFDAGEKRAAAKAKRWIASLQITPEVAQGLPIEKQVGAIAYNQEAYDLAVQGQTDAGADQWRRATAQAVLGLEPVPFRELIGLTPRS